MKLGSLLGDIPGKIAAHLIPLFHDSKTVSPGLIETWVSAIRGVLVTVIAVFIMYLVACLYGVLIPTAKADTIMRDGWLVDTSTFLYLDRELLPTGPGEHAPSKFCQDKPANDIGTLGVDTTIFKHGPVEFHAHFLHHSCAFGPDLPSYNALGAGIVLHFTR